MLRIPEAPAPGGQGAGGLEARARGTLVHRLMETLDLSEPEAPSEQRVGEVAAELGLKSGPADRAEVAALIGAALRAPLARRLATTKRQRVEHPFAFSLSEGEPLVTGVIDLLCEDVDGTALLVDYKSDRLAEGADTAALVERDYEVQRLLYALAVLREGALVVEVVHWFLERPAEPAVARYTVAERATLEEQLALRLAAAWEDPYAVSPQPHRALCLTCPGRGGMCSWDEQMTDRALPAGPAR